MKHHRNVYIVTDGRGELSIMVKLIYIVQKDTWQF